MANVKNRGGRPFLTEKQKQERKDLILLKLEPYLMSGLSVNKSLKEAKIHNSEFYKYMRNDRLFGEKVARYRQYISVLLNQAIVTELLRIVQKQNSNQSLSKIDTDFLFWYAMNSSVCREEWGRPTNNPYFDPEEELQKIKNIVDEKITYHIYA